MEATLDEGTPPASSGSRTSKRDKRASMIGMLKRLESGADTVLPLLIYIVVRSNPPRLVSNIRFIRRYRAENRLVDYYSYCFTNMVIG